MFVLKGVSKSKDFNQAFWSGLKKICSDFMCASVWGDYTNLGFNVQNLDSCAFLLGVGFQTGQLENYKKKWDLCQILLFPLVS